MIPSDQGEQYQLNDMRRHVVVAILQVYVHGWLNWTSS